MLHLRFLLAGWLAFALFAAGSLAPLASVPSLNWAQFQLILPACAVLAALVCLLMAREALDVAIENRWLAIALASIVLLYALNVLAQINHRSITVMVQAATVSLAILAMATTTRNLNFSWALTATGVMALALLAALGLGIIFAPPEGAWFGSLNPNTLAMFAYTLAATTCLTIERWRYRSIGTIAAVTMCVLIAYAMGARSVLLASVASSCTFALWPLICRPVGQWLVTLFWLASAAVVWLISNPEVVDQIEHWSWVVFEKRLASGRSELWSMALAAVHNNPFLGNGTGTITPQIFTDRLVSLHNWYIQVLFQSGIVGLLLWCLILWLAIDKLWGHAAWKMRTFGSFAMGVLVLQTFEVTLTQNNFAFGLPFWLAMGVAFGGARPADDMMAGGILDRECCRG